MFVSGTVAYPNPTSRRHRSVSAKVTDDEYQRIVANANPKTVSEWARAILVHASEPADIEFLLVAEFLALRMIILNLHYSLADGGRTPSIEATKALIDRADAENVDRAQKRIAELGAAAHAAAGRAMTSAADKSHRHL